MAEYWEPTVGRMRGGPKIPDDIRDEIIKISKEMWKQVIRDGECSLCKPTMAGCEPCEEVSLRISRELRKRGVSHDIVDDVWKGRLAERFYGPGVESRHVWIEFPQFGGAILDASARNLDQQGADIRFPANFKNYPPTAGVFYGERIHVGHAPPRPFDFSRPLVEHEQEIDRFRLHLERRPVRVRPYRRRR